MAILEPISSSDAVYDTPKSSRSRKKDSSEKQQLVVTKITQQQRRNDRYSIYINERYSFSLSDYQLAGSGLRIGKVYTEQELQALQDESAFGKAYERSLNYVMIRPRSEYEIRQYLIRTFLYPKPKSYITKDGERRIKKVAVDAARVNAMIERILQRLTDKGYINDRVFAEAWVASRQLTKKSSKRKLEQELRGKGVVPEVIATALMKQDEVEGDNLRALIAKKRRLSRYQDEVKLKQYLLRQGFSYDDIRDALNDRSTKH